MNMNLSRRQFMRGTAALAVTLGLGGCGGTDTGATDKASEASYKIQMVTDTGGVNDQSFNQLAWEGLQKLKDERGWDISYLESKQESDYATNLDKAVDDNANLVWGVGFAMADAVENSAKSNPDVQFAVIDNAYENPPSNLVGVCFRAQEPSFMVGYIAACTTKTGQVGFVGGVSSSIIDQFEWGYKAGVAYGAKEKGTEVTVSAQYADSFTDSAKGKAIASKMFSDGCDVVFHAAGGVGTGVIEAAKEANKYAIGVDKDQAYLAPDNVLTSALKRVDKAVIEVSQKIEAKEVSGGDNMSLGMSEEAVGIPEDHKLMGEDVYKAAIELGDKIRGGSIVPPASEADYATYVAAL
ncbi:BMP family ABC transporter substrate-binding protein [Olsenella uli]|uniref:BMP family ABC transporter substrate-binding protein n=1 Tax=Olsenella uli TaxID=133926 RepID=UPI0028D203A3|nr:BMP family ABC transporter substrate-binding protein [Olsenella uli]